MVVVSILRVQDTLQGPYPHLSHLEMFWYRRPVPWSPVSAPVPVKVRSGSSGRESWYVPSFTDLRTHPTPRVSSEGLPNLH